MRRTAVRGHALRSEGKAYMPGEEEPWLRIRGHIGRGLCECGATSAVEWSDAARKRWHAEHKQAVRGQLSVTASSGPRRHPICASCGNRIDTQSWTQCCGSPS